MYIHFSKVRADSIRRAHRLFHPEDVVNVAAKEHGVVTTRKPSKSVRIQRWIGKRFTTQKKIKEPLNVIKYVNLNVIYFIFEI